MIRRIAVALLLGLTLPAGACVVEPVRAAPCPGGVWIEGHRGPRGAWHPAHWRCPGVVEVE